jgi:hypothetical protein
MSLLDAAEVSKYLVQDGYPPQLYRLDDLGRLAFGLLFRLFEQQLGLLELGSEAIPFRLESGDLPAELLGLFLELSALADNPRLGAFVQLPPLFLFCGSLGLYVADRRLGSNLGVASRGQDRTVVGLTFLLEAVF